MSDEESIEETRKEIDRVVQATLDMLILKVNSLFGKAAKEGFEDVSYLLVEIKLPGNVRSMLDDMAKDAVLTDHLEKVGMTPGRFESMLFSTLVFYGLRARVREIRKNKCAFAKDMLNIIETAIELKKGI